MSYYSAYYAIDQKAKYKHFWKYFSDVSEPILEIGCATGNFIQWHPKGIVGVDQDFYALNVAIQRGFTACQVAVSRGLCFADESFGGVNCSAVLEHVRDPLTVLREIRRVLRPGGKAVFLVPDIKRYRFDFWRDYTHVTPFTKEGLERVAVDAGFTDFQIGRYVFNYLRYLPGSRGARMRVWLDRVEAVIALLLSKDLVLVAYKQVECDT